MKLVIAEKPSVARTIAGVIGADELKDGYCEGNGYLVSWCIGHLVEPAHAEVYDPKYAKWTKEDLPIIPDIWHYVISKAKQKQYSILKELMRRADVESLICATDAGREGELIFRLVYKQAGCKKPFSRLWISSMEDSAIKQGFDALKDGAEYDNLYASALCRSKADWLVGINATRLYSVLYNGSLNVGRVQSPTLAMIVQRAEQIRDFVKEKYYVPHIQCGEIDATGEKIFDPAEAEKITAACDKQQAVLRSLISESKTARPPKLYDLTSLQRDANRIYGYTAQQTLDYIQNLYEKKLTTYPRTDSQYLTHDMTDTAAEIVKVVLLKLSFAEAFREELKPNVSQTVNDKKVSDHHAIIPTVELGAADLTALPSGERNLLYMVASRLVCAVSGPHTFEAVTAEFDCAGHAFAVKGRAVTAEGWKAVDKAFKSSLKEKHDDEEKEMPPLPQLAEGQTFSCVQASTSESWTTPPKPYTEDTLLAAMERAGNEDTDPEAERRGLGTPATRAGVIEKLVQKGFVERKGKQLIPTERGAALISVLPEKLTSPKLTAEWENTLTEIAQGKSRAAEFMDSITGYVRELVETAPEVNDEQRSRFSFDKPKIGVCPRCGGNIHESRTNFYCANKDCGFVMWKNDKFFRDKKTSLTPRMATELLKSGRVKAKGLYSVKTGKKYDAQIVLADTGGKYVNFKLEFEQKGKATKG